MDLLLGCILCTISYFEVKLLKTNFYSAQKLALSSLSYSEGKHLSQIYVFEDERWRWKPYIKY